MSNKNWKAKYNYRKCKGDEIPCYLCENSRTTGTHTSADRHYCFVSNKLPVVGKLMTCDRAMPKRI